MKRLLLSPFLALLIVGSVHGQTEEKTFASGKAAFEKGQWADAVRLMELPKKEAERTGNWDWYSEAVYMQARGLYKLGKSDSMRAVLTNANTVLTINNPKKDRSHLRVRFLLAMKAYGSDEMNEAAKWAFSADSLLNAKTTPLGVEGATYYNLFGAILEDIGRPTQAVLKYKTGLTMLSGATNAEKEMQSFLYSNIGTLLRSQGAFSEALDYLRKDLALSIETSGPDGQLTGDSYLNIGNVYLDAGDNKRALEYYRKAEQNALKNTGALSREAGLIYNSLGLVNQYLNRLPEAEECFKKSLAARLSTYGKNHPQVAVVQNNLAGLYLEMKKYAAAEDQARASLKIRKEAYQEHDSRLFFTRFTLAHTFIAAGKTDSATAVLSKMDAAATGGLKENPRFMADVFYMRGLLADKELKWNDARKHYRTALSKLRQNGKTDQNWLVPLTAFQIMQNYFLVSVKSLSPEETIPLADTLFLVFGALHNSLESTESLQRQTAAFQSVAGKAVGMALKAYETTGKRAYLEKAHQFSLQTKAITLRRLIRENEAKQYAGIPIVELEREQKLASAINKLESDLAVSASGLQKLSDSLMQLRDRHAVLLKEFEKKYPRYFTLRFNRTLPHLPAIQRALEPSEMRIDIAQSDSISHFFFIESGAVSVRTLAFKKVERDSLEMFKKAILENRQDEIRTLGKTFSRKITGSEDGFRANKVHINAMGIWIGFPFDALITRDDKFWIEKYDVRHLSPDGLQRALKQERSDFSYAGFAPVSFGAKATEEPQLAMRSGGTLAPLPFSGKEVVEARLIFEAAAPWYKRYTGISNHRALLKTEATETSVRNLPFSNDLILHFATHTLIDRENPGRSRLILTPDDKEDGWLIQQEIFGLQAPAALVVLNSCASASGEIIPGEGVWGLTTAFRYAGAEKILATMWPVADRPSAAFTATFFKKLAAGDAVSSALSKAKRESAAQPEKFRVRDWAGYVLYD